MGNLSGSVGRIILVKQEKKAFLAIILMVTKSVLGKAMKNLHQLLKR